MTPTAPLAFVAGLLSFLSPCVLPLVPSYLAYIGGSAATSVAAPRRRSVLVGRSLVFIAGFSLVFVAMGASASALGALLRQHRPVLMAVGGVVVVLFGLIMLGVLRVPALYRDTRPQVRSETRSPWGALLLGMAFAAGWTPCIGPILGGILTLAGAGGTLSHGVLLLLAYALGLGVPFLLAAVALEPFLRVSRGLRRALPWIERGAGAVMVLAGLLMVSGTYTRINAVLVKITPSWLLSRL